MSRSLTDFRSSGATERHQNLATSGAVAIMQKRRSGLDDSHEPEGYSSSASSLLVPQIRFATNSQVEWALPAHDNNSRPQRTAQTLGGNGYLSISGGPMSHVAGER